MPYWTRQQWVLFHTVKLSLAVVKQRSMVKGKRRENLKRENSFMGWTYISESTFHPQKKNLSWPFPFILFINDKINFFSSGITYHRSIQSSPGFDHSKTDPSPSLQLYSTSGPHLMAHPRADLWCCLTRPCPGRKRLFRQPYLLWGVKGEAWITLRGPTLSKHWLLSDDRESKRGSDSVSRRWLELHFTLPPQHKTVKLKGLGMWYPRAVSEL